jgi:DNA-binding NarL/FixJ family response regulator
MATVAIIDDHPLTLRGMERVLEEAGFEVGFTGPTESGLDRVDPTPDLVVTDLDGGGGRSGSVGTLAEIAKRAPVLVISASASGVDVFCAIRAGARGYLTKQATDEEFVEAVDTVASGGFHLSLELADAFQTEADRRANGEGDQHLSPREGEALTLVAEGFTHAKAARRMGVSPATFDTYIKRVRTKLGPGNKADLTRMALELAHAAPSDPI